jgi:hypothetical protein
MSLIQKHGFKRSAVCQVLGLARSTTLWRWTRTDTNSLFLSGYLPVSAFPHFTPKKCHFTSIFFLRNKILIYWQYTMVHVV